MCLDARLLPHKLVNMNMNQNSELNFHREKEHVWGPHVSDTIFFSMVSLVCAAALFYGKKIFCCVDHSFDISPIRNLRLLLSPI